jgi:3-methyladenine DNA glycosylase AlkD
MKARSRSSSIPAKRSKGKFAPKKAGEQWNCARALRELRAAGEQRNIEGMARFGIRAKVVYGVAKPKMDELARRIGKNHDLALELWETGVHDARILAGMIDELSQVSASQMECWVRDFDNWDVCDGTCCHLFVFAAPAWAKEFSGAAGRRNSRSAQDSRYLAYRDKSAPDAKYQRLFSIIRREAHDERNFVRKAVNWALRNIGKRNVRLNREAIRAAERIRSQGSRAGRWISVDALRELKSAVVQARLRRKAA